MTSNDVTIDTSVIKRRMEILKLTSTHVTSNSGSSHFSTDVEPDKHCVVLVKVVKQA